MFDFFVFCSFSFKFAKSVKMSPQKISKNSIWNSKNEQFDADFLFVSVI